MQCTPGKLTQLVTALFILCLAVQASALYAQVVSSEIGQIAEENYTLSRSGTYALCWQSSSDSSDQISVVLKDFVSGETKKLALPPEARLSNALVNDKGLIALESEEHIYILNDGLKHSGTSSYKAPKHELVYLSSTTNKLFYLDVMNQLNCYDVDSQANVSTQLWLQAEDRLAFDRTERFCQFFPFSQSGQCGRVMMFTDRYPFANNGLHPLYVLPGTAGISGEVKRFYTGERIKFSDRSQDFVLSCDYDANSRISVAVVDQFEVGETVALFVWRGNLLLDIYRFARPTQVLRSITLGTQIWLLTGHTESATSKTTVRLTGLSIGNRAGLVPNYESTLLIEPKEAKFDFGRHRFIVVDEARRVHSASIRALE